jgi:methylase of polypeptide subunit release factors
VEGARAGARPTPSLTALSAGASAALKAALADAGYRYEAVAGARRMHRLLPADERLSVASLAGGGPRLRALVRLLALGQPVPVDEARTALSPDAFEGLEAAGVLALGRDEVSATCSLLPYNGLLLAADGPGRRDGDVVHAFTNPSLTLARHTPRTPRGSMLDLGTGSGVLALRGASHCDRVTAVDINPRSLMFARFNAHLNGAEDIELLEGSWLEPVADRRFDLIVANPPYVVSPDDEFTYRDSGLPGGALLQRLCRETAAHLNPGGLGILMASWPHASKDDWATPPSAWVRDTGCDALILGREVVDPVEHAVNWNIPPVRFVDPESLRETVARWVGHYQVTGAGMISFGTIVLRRRSSAEPWLSALEARAPAGERAAEQLVRILRGQDQTRALDDRELLERRFSLPTGTDVAQRFQRRPAGFVARPAMMSLEGGLGVRAAIDPDALDVLFACDGTRTLGDVVEDRAERRGVAVAGLAEIAAAAARVLLAHGLLEG